MAAERRMRQSPRFRPPVPVLCVGNYVVGGAGKTPTVIALARVARACGLKPGILARGYGGRAVRPVLVDPSAHSAIDVGDEALLLANAAPTVAASDRVAGARRLLDEGVDLIILDDGFQDPALSKDLTLVVVDADAGVGNGFTLPLGPLRAPLAAQMQRTGALLVIGKGREADPLVRMAARAGKPVLRAFLKPVTTREWKNAKVHAFAGIGRPQKFFDSLAAAGATVVKASGFPDHHPFNEAEASMIVAAADIGQCRLVTTEKDMARLAGRGGAIARLRARSEVFAVTLEFENPNAVSGMIGSAVRDLRLGANGR
jgi:tetraacyldisaccharide 4'-kinase